MSQTVKPIRNEKKTARYSCKYFYSNEIDFILQAEDILRQIVPDKGETVVRIVFFTTAADNEEYPRQYEIANGLITARFGTRQPVWYLVTESPLNAALAAEVHFRRKEKGERFAFRQIAGAGCVTVETNTTKELFFSVISTDLSAPRLDQAKEVFHIVAHVLSEEGMEAGSIVRQWNYVEQITDFTGGIQNYQALNDARAEFYRKSDWKNGYPAATGIGTLAGGIVIDINAVSGLKSQPIDNRMQVAAYDYSKRKLVGGKKTKAATPKFERGKRVFYPGTEIIYVSGTAAIRGEDSEPENAESQTRITIGNIRELIPEHAPGSGRVYVKCPEHFEAIRNTVETDWSGTNFLYLRADICRPELLVEIEALASGQNN